MFLVTRRMCWVSYFFFYMQQVHYLISALTKLLSTAHNCTINKLIDFSDSEVSGIFINPFIVQTDFTN